MLHDLRHGAQSGWAGISPTHFLLSMVHFNASHPFVCKDLHK